MFNQYMFGLLRWQIISVAKQLTEWLERILVLFVIVTGCYAQLESERISKMEGVDLVLGSNEKS